MQIFIYDLWIACQHGLSQMDTNDNTARIFLRFLALAQQNAMTEREVAYYADKLCITPKYLSQVSRSVTGLPASQWIQFYSSFELVSLLNDTTKTLTEVSDLMHFENISHFSRYVKKILGVKKLHLTSSFLYTTVKDREGRSFPWFLQVE
jgi:AraC-like DNA-binding protein